MGQTTTATEIDRENNIFHSTPSEFQKQSSSNGTLSKETPNMKFNADMPPATIKGWLYKRGNDGLKLWKKRYLVLFCYHLIVSVLSPKKMGFLENSLSKLNITT